MKDYKRDLNNFEYGEKYIPNEHLWDSLADKEQVKKLENDEHFTQKLEVGKNVFKTVAELLTPNPDDLKQSSPEITGQYEALH